MEYNAKDEEKKIKWENTKKLIIKQLEWTNYKDNDKLSKSIMTIERILNNYYFENIYNEKKD